MVWIGWLLACLLIVERCPVVAQPDGVGQIEAISALIRAGRFTRARALARKVENPSLIPSTVLEDLELYEAYLSQAYDVVESKLAILPPTPFRLWLMAHRGEWVQGGIRHSGGWIDRHLVQALRVSPAPDRLLMRRIELDILAAKVLSGDVPGAMVQALAIEDGALRLAEQLLINRLVPGFRRQSLRQAVLNAGSMNPVLWRRELESAMADQKDDRINLALDRLSRLEYPVREQNWSRETQITRNLLDAGVVLAEKWRHVIKVEDLEWSGWQCGGLIEINKVRTSRPPAPMELVVPAVRDLERQGPDGDMARALQFLLENDPAPGKRGHQDVTTSRVHFMLLGQSVLARMIFEDPKQTVAQCRELTSRLEGLHVDSFDSSERRWIRILSEISLGTVESCASQFEQPENHDPRSPLYWLARSMVDRVGGDMDLARHDVHQALVLLGPGSPSSPAEVAVIEACARVLEEPVETGGRGQGNGRTRRRRNFQQRVRADLLLRRFVDTMGSTGDEKFILRVLESGEKQLAKMILAQWRLRTEPLDGEVRSVVLQIGGAIGPRLVAVRNLVMIGSFDRARELLHGLNLIDSRETSLDACVLEWWIEFCDGKIDVAKRNLLLARHLHAADPGEIDDRIRKLVSSPRPQPRSGRGYAPSVVNRQDHNLSKRPLPLVSTLPESERLMLALDAAYDLLAEGEFYENRLRFCREFDWIKGLWGRASAEQGRACLTRPIEPAANREQVVPQPPIILGENPPRGHIGACLLALLGSLLVPILGMLFLGRLTGMAMIPKPPA